MSIKVIGVGKVGAGEAPISALARFVAEARDLEPYGVVWESAVWNVGSSDIKKRAHLNNSQNLFFTEHAGARVPVEQRVVFHAPYADLVKACIVRRRVQRGMGRGPQMVFVRASRYLYQALPLPARLDPTLITRGHFAAAEAAIMLAEKPSSAYRAGQFLDAFAGMLDRHALCRAPISFRTSIKKPRDEADRTSATFEKRVEGLPTAELLNALATIANDEKLGQRPFDLLRTRISELLLVAGFRAGEVLTLPNKPLVREFVLDEAGGIRLDAQTGTPIERLGLRYWPEKGGEPIVKWLPTAANSMVLRALDDIERLCRPARENAAWLRAHPGDVNIGVQGDEQISYERAAAIIGLVPGKSSVLRWLKGGKRSVAAEYRMASKEASVSGNFLRRAMASDRFDKPLLTRADGKRQFLGESLFAMFMHDSSDARPVNRCISLPIQLQHLSDFLCGRDGVPSVFERHDYRDDEGKPFRIKTHDFRRLLNVIAQRGGLSQVEIAQWMGRRQVGDNVAYDLRTATEMAYEMRALVSKNEVYGVIADQVRNLPETERGAFLETRLAMIHTTPHGHCASNIVESPCATAVSCLGGCRQYLRRKGDEKSRASLQRIERESVVNLQRAREAADAGKYNAENWVLSQETVLKNARRALAIDDDPSIADGELRHVSPDGQMLGEPL